MSRGNDKPVRQFEGTHEQCDDWLLNHGFRYDRGTWEHPKLVAIRITDRKTGLCTVKLFKR